MDSNIITQDEVNAWEKYKIGKPCKYHPFNLVKKGKWGSYCGGKTEVGTWCSGGSATKDFLINYREKNNV